MYGITDLAAIIKVDIANGYYINVFMWMTRDAMRRHSTLEGDYDAQWHMARYRIDADGVKHIPAKFGRMFLCLDRIAAGIFAHELTHFLLDWIGINEFDYAKSDNEGICKLVGQMTADFWAAFYGRFSQFQDG